MAVRSEHGSQKEQTGPEFLKGHNFVQAGNELRTGEGERVHGAQWGSDLCETMNLSTHCGWQNKTLSKQICERGCEMEGTVSWRGNLQKFVSLNASY